MATEEPGRATQAPALTALPRVEDLPTASQGYEPERVREAFDAFRRHATQLQVQLRVLPAAGRRARSARPARCDRRPAGHGAGPDAAPHGGGRRRKPRARAPTRRPATRS